MRSHLRSSLLLPLALGLLAACGQGAADDGAAAADGGAGALTTTQSGTQDGYFYTFYAPSSCASMTLGPAGNYGMVWSSCAVDFFGGKGWAVGGRRVVSYSATFNAAGPAFLAVYGWTTNPNVEYYIVENWGSYRPTQGTYKGTVVSDGGAYDLYEQRHTGPIIALEGAGYTTYWSVRQTRRTTGSVTTGNHFDAWARRGMALGAFNYMILSTEAYQGSGRASVTLLAPAP